MVKPFLFRQVKKTRNWLFPFQLFTRFLLENVKLSRNKIFAFLAVLYVCPIKYVRQSPLSHLMKVLKVEKMKVSG